VHVGPFDTVPELELCLGDESELNGLLRYDFSSVGRFGRDEQELALNEINRFIQRIPKFLKIFFVQEDLVLLVLLFTDTLAFRNGDVEVLFRLCRLHIKEIRPFAGANTFCEDLIFVCVFQGATTSLQVC